MENDNYIKLQIYFLAFICYGIDGLMVKNIYSSFSGFLSVILLTLSLLWKTESSIKKVFRIAIGIFPYFWETSMGKYAILGLYMVLSDVLFY